MSAWTVGMTEEADGSFKLAIVDDKGGDGVTVRAGTRVPIAIVAWPRTMTI